VGPALVRLDNRIQDEAVAKVGEKPIPTVNHPHVQVATVDDAVHDSPNVGFVLDRPVGPSRIDYGQVAKIADL